MTCRLYNRSLSPGFMCITTVTMSQHRESQDVGVVHVKSLFLKSPCHRYNIRNRRLVIARKVCCGYRQGAILPRIIGSLRLSRGEHVGSYTDCLRRSFDIIHADTDSIRGTATKVAFLRGESFAFEHWSHCKPLVNVTSSAL